MNKRELFEILGTRIWVMRSTSGQWVTMGKQSQALVIKFIFNGQLDFPSDIKYLPGTRYWDWDETKQRIILMDASYNKVQELLPPEVDGHGYFIRNNNLQIAYDSHQLYEAILSDNKMNDALVQDFGRTAINKHPLAIIDSEIENNNEIISDLNSIGVEVHRLPNFENDFNFLVGAYQLLMEEQTASNVGIFTNNVELIWSASENNSKLRIIYNKNFFAGVIGDRYLILEFLGILLIKHKQNILMDDKETINAEVELVLDKYFSDRYEFKK